MKGWDIFRHSVRQVFGNLGAALRVSALLFGVPLVVGFAIAGPVLGGAGTGLAPQVVLKSIIGPVLIFVALFIFCGLWIAVGWHRYVLLAEEPSLLPRLRVDRILGYFGKGFLIALVMIIPAIGIGLIYSAVVLPFMLNFGPPAPLPVDFFPTLPMRLMFALAGTILAIPLTVIAYRLSTVLPGVALEAGKPLFEGWSATAGESGTIFVLAVITGAAEFVIGLPSEILASPEAIAGAQSVPMMIWNAVILWVQMMVGLSILTTLYGHYIEKRPLV